MSLLSKWNTLNCLRQFQLNWFFYGPNCPWFWPKQKIILILSTQNKEINVFCGGFCSIYSFLRWKYKFFIFHAEKQAKILSCIFFLRILTGTSLSVSQHLLTTISQIDLMKRDSRKLYRREYNFCEVCPCRMFMI